MQTVVLLALLFVCSGLFTLAFAQAMEMKRLRRIAYTDPVTGLPNRRAAEEELARRKHEPVAVVFVDLDDFKALNDAKGHAAGDEALRKAAQAMKLVLRPEDKVFRFGGDEFIVVAGRANFCLADQLASRIESALPYMQLSASTGIGIALGDAMMAVDCADRQMYLAKAAKKRPDPDPLVA